MEKHVDLHHAASMCTLRMEKFFLPEVLGGVLNKWSRPRFLITGLEQAASRLDWPSSSSYPTYSSHSNQPTTGRTREERQGDTGVFANDNTQPDVYDRVPKSGKESNQEKLNNSKKKRIRQKQNKTKISTLKFIGNNANGLFNKFESLENMLKENPSVVFIQET